MHGMHAISCVQLSTIRSVLTQQLSVLGADHLSTSYLGQLLPTYPPTAKQVKPQQQVTWWTQQTPAGSY